MNTTAEKLLVLTAGLFLALGFIGTAPTDAAVCARGEVAFLDRDEGLVCRSLVRVLDTAASVTQKQCPTGEYLAGFDSGVDDPNTADVNEADDGTLVCRPDAQRGISGVSLACEQGQYLKGISSGEPNCRSLPSANLSSAGTCTSSRPVVRGFNASGRVVCMSIPTGAVWGSSGS